MSRFSEPLRRTLVSFVGVAAFLTGIVAIPAAPAAAAVTATHFKVEATPSSVTAGDATTITVTAQGDGDVTATGYNGTVHFSVDNPQPTETLPSDTAFDGTTGVLTITDGVTLTLAGSRTLTVTDATDDAISGSTGINVSPADPALLSFSNQPSDTFSHHEINDVTVEILDQFSNQTDATHTIQVTANGGGFDNGTDSITAAGGAATFSHLVLNTPGTYTLDAIDTTDENVAGSTSDSFDVLPHADIALTMSASPNGTVAHPAVAGTNEVYTLTVTNDGPDANTRFRVTAAIPPGTSLVSAPGCSGTGPVTCGLNGLSNGSHHDFAITLHINSSYAGSDNTEPLTFTATVALTNPTQSPDNVVSNDTASVALTVVAQADLAIAAGTPTYPGTQTAAWANANSAQNFVIYEYTLTNNGPSDAQSVSINNTLASDMTLVGACAGVATCMPNQSFPLNIGTLNGNDGSPANQSVHIRIKATATSPGGGPLTKTNKSSASSTTTDVAGSNNTNVTEDATVWTVPSTPTDPDARPGSGNAYFLWKEADVSASNGGSAVDSFRVAVTGPSAPSVPDVLVGDNCGTSGNQQTFCTNVAPLLTTVPPTTYTFVVRAHNDVGFSAATTGVTAAPSNDDSAQQIKNGSLTQQTGTTTSKTNKQITIQAFPTGTTGVGAIVETTAGAGSFCNGQSCVGQIVRTELLDPNLNGIYQITLLYDKTLIGGTGLKYKFFYSPLASASSGTQLAKCGAITPSMTTPCVVVKLASAGANPALKAVVYTRDDDPTVGGKGFK
jgi:uncharacterized repeat protein (TIGR01451 family)